LHRLTNNCEHFVSWCLTGTARSRQVECWQDRLAAGRAALTRAGRWLIPDAFRRFPAFARHQAG
jgi:hypothetical protein